MRAKTKRKKNNNKKSLRKVKKVVTEKYVSKFFGLLAKQYDFLFIFN